MNPSAKEQITDEVVRGIYEAYPDLHERFGERGLRHTREDNFHHLDHLETAYSLGSQELFVEYTEWLESVLTSRNVGPHLIIDNFERLSAVIPDHVPEPECSFMLSSLTAAIRRLQRNPQNGGDQA